MPRENRATAAPEEAATGPAYPRSGENEVSPALIAEAQAALDSALLLSGLLRPLFGGARR